MQRQVCATNQRETKLFSEADIKEKTVKLTLSFNDDYEYYAEQIKLYRKRNNLTQEELAAIIKIPHPTLRSWEQKLAKPPYYIWRLHRHLFNNTVDFP